MPQFDKLFPEIGVLPASTAGSPQVPTKLHALRSRQLLDLVNAFQLEIPPPRNKVNYTKAELLTYLQPHEEMGTFQQPPKSRYHLLHAQFNHDARGEAADERNREVLQRELTKAEWDEFPPDNKARYQQKAQEGDTHAYWQQEAKRLGLKGTMGKTRDELKALVQDEVARLASAADSEQPAS
jgi:hypothetical protein